MNRKSQIYHNTCDDTTSNSIADQQTDELKKERKIDMGVKPYFYDSEGGRLLGSREVMS